MKRKQLLRLQLLFWVFLNLVIKSAIFTGPLLLLVYFLLCFYWIRELLNKGQRLRLSPMLQSPVKHSSLQSYSIPLNSTQICSIFSCLFVSKNVLWKTPDIAICSVSFYCFSSRALRDSLNLLNESQRIRYSERSHLLPSDCGKRERVCEETLALAVLSPWRMRNKSLPRPPRTNPAYFGSCDSYLRFLKILLPPKSHTNSKLASMSWQVSASECAILAT